MSARALTLDQLFSFLSSILARTFKFNCQVARRGRYSLEVKEGGGIDEEEEEERTKRVENCFLLGVEQPPSARWLLVVVVQMQSN